MPGDGTIPLISPDSSPRLAKQCSRAIDVAARSGQHPFALVGLRRALIWELVATLFSCYCLHLAGTEQGC